MLTGVDLVKERVLDLRREAKRRPLGPISPCSLDDEDRQRAIQNWLDRMVSEHASARVFASLVPQMMAASLPRRHIRAVAEMVGQELDHAVLCASVVEALGTPARAPMSPSLEPVPHHEDVAPLEAVLRNVISIGCLSETVAVALVGAEREMAATTELERVLSEILADEVKHARLGWRLCADLLPSFGAAEKERLTRYLVVALRHQVQFHGAFLDMGRASDDAVAIGAPDGPGNWTTFIETIEEVSLPGLERFGLGAREAWREALRGAR